MIPLDHRDTGNRADPYTEPNSCFSDSSDSLNSLNSLNSIKVLLHLEKTPMARIQSSKSSTNRVHSRKPQSAVFISPSLCFVRSTSNSHNCLIFFFISGHFTQVVWEGTKEVGFGFATYQDGEYNKLVVVGNYYPAGNIMKQFEDNVKPAKDKECDKTDDKPTEKKEDKSEEEKKPAKRALAI